MNQPLQPSASPTQPAHHPWIYLNGEIVAAENAMLPVTTQAFNYGTAVFEGIRGYQAHEPNTLNIFRLDDHIERLVNSAALLLINDLPAASEIKTLTLDLLRRNDCREDCYIRPVSFKRQLLPGIGFGVKLSGLSSGLSVNTLNMRAYVKQDGLKCTLSSWRRIADNSIPARAKITGSYVNSALAMESAYRGGFDDALMLNIHGNLAEATTSNIFIVKKGRLITPPLNAHILEGITRDTVINLAEKFLGLKVEQRDILPSEALTAEECFLSGTGVEIAPVAELDFRKFSSMKENSISLTLRELYQQVVRGQHNEFRHWLTSVY